MEKQKLSKANRAIIDAFANGYRCREDGTVLKPDGTIQKLCESALGYKRFGYKFEGKIRSLLAHRFVMFCRVGDKIFTKGLYVLHKNDIGTDNSVTNLYLGTAKDNGRDRVTNKRSGKQGMYKMLYSEIYNHYLVFGQKRTCDRYDVTVATVQNIVKRFKNAKHTTSSQISIPF